MLFTVPRLLSKPLAAVALALVLLAGAAGLVTSDGGHTVHAEMTCEPIDEDTIKCEDSIVVKGEAPPPSGSGRRSIPGAG